ncbi:hypothetical protein PIN31115_03437 [Pandoraea iniqua]|uniref:eCIS core domain-containing protein n=1 Tax=Pandoraea iniqua TaxID=2508288 RepID=A0A5E4WQC4_9BURK|nr:DUF4157 domain-containing protein [Pandoraea iniqua]VVE26942.1 hypothetical protein PIN31115_03437 [Pandoraea iniqua]
MGTGMGDRIRKPAQSQDATRVVQAKSAVAGGGHADFADNRPEAEGLRQLQAMADNSPRMVAQRQAQAPINRTGLPDSLKSGVESLSGMSMDHVRVHYNSPAPAQLSAHAYAQGNDIHLGPGQEHHLPHEAWHVVQQAQDRVRPTMQLKAGVPVNDDEGLEREADEMGAKALASGNPATA